MNRTYFRWLMMIALGGFVLAMLFLHRENTKPDIPSQGALFRPASPFSHYISATGIVEASSDNIYIGSPLNRIVNKVYVAVGEKVHVGQTLFRLESRDLEAELAGKLIAHENARLELQKLEALPRKEDVMAAYAALKNAEIRYIQALSQWERVAGLDETGAMSQEAVWQRKFAKEEAEANFERSSAEYEKIKQGAWLPDIEMAKLKVDLAKADAERIQTEIGRTTVTSPINATVLQVKIHEGEFPPTDTTRSAAMIIGNTDRLHLRVNINQFDASYFSPEAKAVAFLQGNASQTFQLKFVALEPLFVPKQYLTNDIKEKIDTRVLQAIYTFQEGNQRIYVGQQMDVFIETPPLQGEK